MTDHDDLRALLVRYCHLCDDGEFGAFAALFDDDATFTVMGETYEGRGPIQSFMTAAQPPEARGKHMISQPLISVDGDTATAATDYAFVGRGPHGFAITSSGRYVDRFVRRDGQWLFAAREIVFVGD
jgi:uncharacterized protein (TIGR02246 family)